MVLNSNGEVIISSDRNYIIRKVYSDGYILVEDDKKSARWIVDQKGIKRYIGDETRILKA